MPKNFSERYLASDIGLNDILALKNKRHAAAVEEEPSTPTLEEYYKDTFKPVYLESAVASSTASTYVNVFKNHITPALGTLHLDEITTEKIEEFVSDLVKKKLAKATIHTILKDLCKFFNHAC